MGCSQQSEILAFLTSLGLIRRFLNEGRILRTTRSVTRNIITVKRSQSSGIRASSSTSDCKLTAVKVATDQLVDVQAALQPVRHACAPLENLREIDWDSDASTASLATGLLAYFR